MPLVPAPVYSAWFSRKSRLYSAFTYWFNNPLWQTSVPNGFSLCGYFWMAVAAVVLLRPLVYLTLGLRWVAQALRVTSFIRWTDSLVVRTFGQSPAPMGVHTAVGFVMLGIVSILGTAIVAGLMAAWSADQFLTSLAFPLNTIVLAVCGAYYSETKGRDDRCRVEWYVRALLGLSLVALLVFHTGAFVDAFVGIPMAAVAGIWHGACWLAGSCWWLVKWFVLGAISGLPYALLTLVVMLVLGVIGYFATRLMPDPKVQPESAGLTKAQIAANLTIIAGALFGRTTLGMRSAEAAVALSFAAQELARSRVLTGSVDVPESLTDAIMDEVRQREQEAFQRSRQRSAACKRFTAGLAALCSPVVAVWRQIRIGCSYGWALFRAVKGKQCPYLRFED